MNRDLSILNNDSGSNYRFSDIIKNPDVPRSAFDMSYVNTLTCDIGQCIPVWTQHSLQKEDWKQSLESIVRVVNPPVVPLMSRQRVFFHTYWCSYYQLWRYAQIFFDKGRTSKVAHISNEMTIPYFTLHADKIGPSTLADYLGFQFSKHYLDYHESSDIVQLPALKFMMYLRVWRDYYMNQRIYARSLEKLIESSTGDTKESYSRIYNFLFPLDDADFRIGSAMWNALQTVDFDYLFGQIQYRDYADDYFTTAQTEPVYTDDVPYVDVDGEAEIEINPSLGELSGLRAYSLYGQPTIRPLDLGMYNNGYSQNVIRALDEEGSPLGAFPNDSPIAIRGKEKVKISQLKGLTLDKIRNCESATLILEKMAKTDGSYREFSKVMFGESPESAYDYRPTYVGGTYQPIVFTQVVNSTQTFTAGSSPQPTSRALGSLGGLGISSASGDIGSHHSDDYGIYMTIMSIVPDTYYCQGWSREDTYLTSDDFYLPDRARLGMQAILNKEIYYDNTNNDQVFGYQNRYDELRYRANEVHGKVADVNNTSFNPYVQSRIFSSRPTLNSTFLTLKDNVSKNWLTSIYEVPYLVQIANHVRAVRPVPYKAQPDTRDI